MTGERLTHDVEEAARRWRLVLGRYAASSLATELHGRGVRIDRALEFLYGREYEDRGMRAQPGSLGPSQLTIPEWLDDVRELFPREVVEVVERHALHRYGLTELVTDPRTLEKLEPNTDLLKTLLSLRRQLAAPVLGAVRDVIRTVVDEIRARIESDVRRALSGRRNRLRHGLDRLRQNFDAQGTIRANLRNFDQARRRLVIERAKFFERNRRRVPWQIILCVDQSASMADSVIHSAVMAGIFSSLPSLRVSLVAFDTSVVDLTEHVSDPVEVLMGIQLGGGTDIAKAMRFCEGLVDVPARAVVVLISDFAEGGSPDALVQSCRRLREARARLLGLASLDRDAMPVHDHAIAQRLAEAGMEIASLTPKNLAAWLVTVIS